ncbi:MAG: hypothetical protein J5998_03975 [Clostridia bacterium]|nr:hypothetical protein [Clostridia bacterium]
MNRISVDFSKQVGAIRPLHGVNSGPRTYSFYHNTTQYFQEAGIPYSRLHDTEYPYGSGHFVDIPCIFKNFDADENDPASYDFEMTDMYIQAIYEAGTKVFYRLGASIEHAPIKRNIYPPKDPAKWARICEHVVRHYNEGWANGFHYGIEYWEIWNEPEGNGTWRISMWMGSDEEYFNLYSITANHLKKCFPNIKVGGYASCGFYAAFAEAPTENHKKILAFADDFFRYITAPATRAPLDFFSWHIYSNDLYLYENCARYARSLMAKYGFSGAESILDEWNYGGEDMFNRMRNEYGAALAAGALCVMQHNEVNLANYYDSQPAMCYCGIFSLETREPTKTFYSLKAWNELYKLGSEVETASDCPDVRLCAAVNGGNGGILISSYKAEDSDLWISVRGLRGGNGVKASVWMTDKDHFFEKVSEEVFYGDQISFLRRKDAYTTLYIELEVL